MVSNMPDVVRNINDLLPQDVLWTIFSLNSVDAPEEMRTRLRNTIATTHVCREWHGIVVGGTSIWGSLQLFDYGSLDESMIQEIIKRSGDARLWVEITGMPNVDDARDLLWRVLPGLWSRIERFKASVRVYSQHELDSYFLPLLRHPAPLLREVHYTSLGWRGWSGVSPAQSPYLFSNTAPRLQTFSAQGLPIPVNASWLSGLTSLETGPLSSFTMDILQTLQVLGRMPLLQSLILDHDIPHVVHDIADISSYPTVYLNNLKYMAIRGHATTSVALVDRIKRSRSGCLVNLGVYTYSSMPNSDVVLASLFNQTFSRNVEFIHGSNQLDWICLCIQGAELVFADRGCCNYDLIPPAQPTENATHAAEPPQPSSKGIYLKFIMNSQNRQALLHSVLNTILECPSIKDITTLRLVIQESIHGLVYAEPLSRFTSVTTLEATPHSLFSFGIWRNRHDSHLPFPNCTTLRLLCETDATMYYAQLLRDELRVRALSPSGRRVSTVELFKMQQVEDTLEPLSQVPYVSSVLVEDDKEGKNEKVITLVYGNSIVEYLP
ncbi:hypothetical protein CPC08DRAFT_823666 [Agrocybe pediades]|nr:hypothetical protein CPC08DRAFT_823666 [Agrocybe pediades]